MMGVILPDGYWGRGMEWKKCPGCAEREAKIAELGTERTEAIKAWTQLADVLVTSENIASPYAGAIALKERVAELKREVEGLERFRKLRIRHNDEMQRVVGKNVELERDKQRLEKLFRAIRDSLDTDHGIEQLTMAFGDAPADCNCREAHCPHEPIAPGIDSIREMVDAAPIGWTYAELAQQARDDACTDCGAPPEACTCP